MKFRKALLTFLLAVSLTASFATTKAPAPPPPPPPPTQQPATIWDIIVRAFGMPI